MIHNTAVICDGAEISEDVDIGPYCYIGKQTKIGKNCKIHSHVVVNGDTEIANVDLTGRIAMVMGSEGRGIRQQSRQHCDHLAVIPMVIDTFGFNVSVATGICLYEAHRQRHIGS